MVTQTRYGKNKPSIHYLIEVNDNNVTDINTALGFVGDKENKGITKSNYMYGVWVTEKEYSEALKGINKYLYIQY